MVTYQDDDLKTVEIPEKQSQRDWLKDQLVDMQKDQALYSELKDRLAGKKDEDTGLLLEEIQSLQLEIISWIGKELSK